MKYDCKHIVLLFGSTIGLMPLLADATNPAGTPSIRAAAPETFAFGRPGTQREVTRVIKIRALDNHFEPKSVTVIQGTTVKFIVTDVGKLSHEFVLGDRNEQEEHEKEMKSMGDMPMADEANGIDLNPGQTKTLIWTFTQDGVIEYACHSLGHFDAGMIGTVVVRPVPNKPRQ